MSNSTAITQGLTQEFIDDLQARIADRVLEEAVEYFRDGRTAYSSHPGLKRVEMAQQFFDYQPCCVSILARLAADGSTPAMMTVRRIFENEQYFLDEWRAREGYRFCLRRVQLHLAIAYEILHDVIEPDAALRWRALLLRSAEDILQHFDRFRERVPSLDNRAFGTGINHVALSAESIWRTGAVLDRPDLCDVSARFIDRLLAYGHPDGYFEEHTNDAREGGPSLLYTGLTAGAAFTVTKWRGMLDRERFRTCGAFYRNMVDAAGNTLTFADERANPTSPNCFGLALHSIDPEGRAFLRQVLDPSAPLVSGANLHNAARIALELENCETGEGAEPEGHRDGHFRLSLPIGVSRTHGWTAGLSALNALNRVISPDGDYALDRQSLLYLSHRGAGVILRGAKSKRDPAWSTLRLGEEDAWPVRPGELSGDTNTLSAKVYYDAFTADVSWDLGEDAKLTVATDAASALLQLVLEARVEERLSLDGEPVTLGEEAFRQEGVTRVETPSWSIASSTPGCIAWYISPFNPYAEANLSPPGSRRPVFALPVEGSVSLTFHART